MAKKDPYKKTIDNALRHIKKNGYTTQEYLEIDFYSMLKKANKPFLPEGYDIKDFLKSDYFNDIISIGLNSVLRKQESIVSKIFDCPEETTIDRKSLMIYAFTEEDLTKGFEKELKYYDYIYESS